MKREYTTPEYNKNNQLEDIILVSVTAEGDTLTGSIDIEAIFAPLS